jgi:hypothetical protein
VSVNEADMKDEKTGERKTDAAEEPPPIGGSWTTLYTVVLLNLAVLIVLFYLFTRAFG